MQGQAMQWRMWLVGSDKINSSLFNFKAEATKSEEGKAMYLVRLESQRAEWGKRQRDLLTEIFSRLRFWRRSMSGLL